MAAEARVPASDANFTATSEVFKPHEERIRDFAAELP
jgi:hypothetical protein